MLKLTKSQQGMLNNFNRAYEAGLVGLDSVYNSYSHAKANSFREIWRMSKSIPDSDKTTNVYITSHNTMMYTCAYEREHVDPLTGEVSWWLIYHAPCHCFCFEIELEDSVFYNGRR